MDFMLDLETLSSQPDAAIVAIGICTFSHVDAAEGRQRHKFYKVIDPESAQRSGGRIDAATVQWWMRQDLAARSVFNAGVAFTIDEALNSAHQFIRSFGERPRVWGNGASFDNVILRGAYERLGLKAPWEFRDERCYRTLKNLYRDIAFEATGVAHHALDDAISQAIHAERIFYAMAKLWFFSATRTG